MESSKRSRIAVIALIFIIIIILSTGGVYYYYVKQPNFYPQETVYVYVYPQTPLSDLQKQLNTEGRMKNEATFNYLANNKDLARKMKPGRYAIVPGMNNITLIQLLLTGHQTPVRLTFNNIRTLPQLAGRLSRQLMADSLSLLQTFNNSQFLEKFGFTHETLPAMFIPNTYEIYWTVSPEKFCERMKAEYDRFWDGKRRKEAEEIGLSPVDVCTLASIVEEETNKKEEFSIVAGLYINRLKIGMKLQADPTVKYAVGNFMLRRVLNTHLGTDSPYNTYLNYGLPPGPIRLPSVQVVDAVLNYVEHNYLYMCAKEDLSGRHNFTSSGAQHAVNRANYTAALNRLKIYR
ncbi:MAG: endolytic transglycosylase MltG [Bacteroidales bacterium]|jgi:UPF0755 protein|nr:endolytic transglycosylase MltG [Bacteroidales bacterium]